VTIIPCGVTIIPSGVTIKHPNNTHTTPQHITRSLTLARSQGETPCNPRRSAPMLNAPSPLRHDTPHTLAALVCVVCCAFVPRPHFASVLHFNRCLVVTSSPPGFFDCYRRQRRSNKTKHNTNHSLAYARSFVGETPTPPAVPHQCSMLPLHSGTTHHTHSLLSCVWCVVPSFRVRISHPCSTSIGVWSWLRHHQAFLTATAIRSAKTKHQPTPKPPTKSLAHARSPHPPP